MKKTLLLAVAVCAAICTNAFASGDLTLKAGYDFMGRSTLDGYNTGTMPSDETQGGFTFAAEYSIFNMEKFFCGVGAKYAADRKTNGTPLSPTLDSATYGALPLYIYGAVTPAIFGIETGNGIIPYLKADFGYIVYAPNLTAMDKTTGTWYYGFGFGTEIKDFIIEVSYSMYQYDNEFRPGETNTLKFATTTLSVGYKIAL